MSIQLDYLNGPEEITLYLNKDPFALKVFQSFAGYFSVYSHNKIIATTARPYDYEPISPDGKFRLGGSSLTYMVIKGLYIYGAKIVSRDLKIRTRAYLSAGRYVSYADGNIKGFSSGYDDGGERLSFLENLHLIIAFAKEGFPQEYYELFGQPNENPFRF